MVFENGAAVSVNGGFILDFDLTRTEAGAGALVNNLSIIQGAPLYTLTVDGTQADGIYSLADGADGFNSTITVVNVAGDELGMLSVGQKVLIGDTEYTLNLNDTMTGSTLAVTVAGSEPVPPTPTTNCLFYTGDFNGDGKCDMLWRNSFIGEGGLTYNAYCTWIVDDPVDWRMVSVANPVEWNFLCSGDFDGNGMNDIAMINDVGVVGIWGVNDGYLSSWSILSAVDTSSWSLVGVGDFNADGTDDIAWCNNETNLAGYWQINDKQLTAWANLGTLG